MKWRVYRLVLADAAAANGNAQVDALIAAGPLRRVRALTALVGYRVVVKGETMKFAPDHRRIIAYV